MFSGHGCYFHAGDFGGWGGGFDCDLGKGGEGVLVGVVRVCGRGGGGVWF